MENSIQMQTMIDEINRVIQVLNEYVITYPKERRAKYLFDKLTRERKHHSYQITQTQKLLLDKKKELANKEKQASDTKQIEVIKRLRIKSEINQLSNEINKTNDQLIDLNHSRDLNALNSLQIRLAHPYVNDPDILRLRYNTVVEQLLNPRIKELNETYKMCVPLVDTRYFKLIPEIFTDPNKSQGENENL